MASQETDSRTFSLALVQMMEQSRQPGDQLGDCQDFILINSNVNSHVGLLASILDSTVLSHYRV